MGSQGKKYDWKIGEELPTLDEHSQTKHLVISEYLKRYVEVVMSNAQMQRLSLSVIDGFAGGGRYKNALSNDVSDGSPFLILDAIREAEVQININRKNPRKIDAEYHFIDSNKSHCEFLGHEISHSLYSPNLNTNIKIYHSKFSSVSSTIISHLKKRNPRTQRAIFILDQYAYKDVPFNAAKDILSRLTNSEIILTFNYDALQRYTG